MVSSGIYLGEVNAECVHIETIEKASKRFAKSGQALVHKLEMHHIRFKIGHCVRQLGERWFERV